MQNKFLNKRIIKIWNKHFKDEKVLTPLFFWKFEKNPILFIGLNPSFTEKFSKKYKKFLFWGGKRKDMDTYVDKVIAIDSRAKSEYRIYFGRMIDLSKEINIPFEHTDLFFYRETNQNNFKKMVFVDKKFNKLNDFGKDQITIAFDAISVVNPRVIIVNNAFASDIFKREWKRKLNFDNNKGWYTISVNNKKVPIFFSSMAGGQRALDRHTWQRLKWHIKKALE